MSEKKKMSVEERKKLYPNLTPINERPLEDRKAIQEKASKAGVEARRKIKSFREMFQALLSGDYIDKNGNKVTGYELISNAMVEQAESGNVTAFNSIRDTVGEKPTDKVEADTNVTVKFNIPRPNENAN
ncbi:MAG: hypothetical protein IJ981_03175 [Clostridia bacterium]|nr:hypothetical protein [Clostridia bacterium]